EDYPALRVRESTDYALMKERARVLATAQYGELLRYYRNVGAPDNGNPADTYGYALTLMRSGAASQAVELLQALAQEHAEQFHYVTALAEAQKMAGQPQAAEATLQQALSRFGDKPALVLQYAGLLLANNQPQAARALLKRHPSLVASNDRAQEILAEAAGKQDRLGEAYYHQAQYFRMRGAYVPAIRRLRTVLHRNQLGSVDRDRLNALLGQIIRDCNRAWSERECRQRV